MTPQVYKHRTANFEMTQDASDPDITTVTIREPATGIYAKGHAKRVPGDTYDENIGIALASYRALSRLCRKLEHHLIVSLGE